MRRERRGDVDGAAARVRHRDAPRQEVQPVLQAARQIPLLLVEIFGIADDGVIDLRKSRVSSAAPSTDRRGAAAARNGGMRTICPG